MHHRYRDYPSSIDWTSLVPAASTGAGGSLLIHGDKKVCSTTYFGRPIHSGALLLQFKWKTILSRSEKRKSPVL